MIGWTMPHSLPIRREVVSRGVAVSRGFAVPPSRSTVTILHLDGPVEIPAWPAYHLPLGHELDADHGDVLTSVPLPRDIEWRLWWEREDGGAA